VPADAENLPFEVAHLKKSFCIATRYVPNHEKAIDEDLRMPQAGGNAIIENISVLHPSIWFES